MAGEKKMDFLQLQYFLAVAEYKNFTKAARATYTSQPNISKQISQLEEDLGVRLFHRTNSGAELTMAGSYLYKGLSEQLPKLDRLFERTRELGKDGDENRIRLGLFESMDLERIIPSFFPKFFQAMESGIRIQIETYSIARLLEKLAVEDLDCVFFFSTLKADIPGVRRMPVSRANQRIYYSANHPLAKKEHLSANDFADAAFVHCVAGEETESPYDALPFVPQRIIEANSINAAFLYIESGEAVGLFGPSQNRLGKEGICTLEILNEKKVGADVLWLEKKDNPILERFLCFLRNQFLEQA